VRTAFQRDRDRVLHSKSFRRLKHKTQVFISPEGDHYRTRMTHTLEVSQIARTVGRALRLNEDLIEAIALAHDLGHPPFGHAGESALDAAICELDDPIAAVGFRHYEQSLRVVDVLEDLNLTQEVREGIAGHSKGRNDLRETEGEPGGSLEAAVVRICDRIAYLNHDLDDALRAGIIGEVPAIARPFGETHSDRIGGMVEDLIVASYDRPEIRVSPEVLAGLNDLKEWLFEHVYTRYPAVYPEIDKAKALVRALFQRYAANPEELPEGYAGARGAVDYVAGMTDRFAMETFLRLTMPESWRRPRG
jgi:dGTPase